MTRGVGYFSVNSYTGYCTLYSILMITFQSDGPFEREKGRGLTLCRVRKLIYILVVFAAMYSKAHNQNCIIHEYRIVYILYLPVLYGYFHDGTNLAESICAEILPSSNPKLCVSATASLNHENLRYKTSCALRIIGR